jgi:hypothetical protein
MENLTIKKGKQEFTITDHVIERFHEKFGMTVKTFTDSFTRSKCVTDSNCQKFGKTISNRLYSFRQYKPNQAMYVNAYYDQVIIVDYSTNSLVTTYKLSKATEFYNLNK